MNYADIGHRHDDDVVWIFRKGRVEQTRRVTSTEHEPWTHHQIWGGETDECWHGRQDVKTLKASIVGPVGTDFLRPPRALLDAVAEALPYPVARWYFFADKTESITPNPDRRRLYA